MDVLHSCRCCLRGASDKDLTMPYTYLGKTEIYADMLKECFDFHVKLVDEASSGICWTCVDRLRDACHFKLQVERSEAELQKALLVKVEPPVSPEMSDANASIVVLSDDETIENTAKDNENEPDEALDEETKDNTEMDDIHEPEEVLDEETKDNTEMDDIHEPEEVLDEDPLLQSEAEDDVMSISDSSEAADAGSEQPEPAHAKKKHAPNYSEKLECLQSDDKQSKGHTYACEECDRAFENMSILKTHIQVTHSSSTLSKEEYSQKHQTNNGENPFECSTTLLENHQVLHSGRQKLFQCSQCDFKSNQKSHVQRHQMIHTGEKPYSCNYCDLKYSRKGFLEKHLKAKHTDEKLYSCNYCQFKCNETESLQCHLSIHAEENMYSCTYCFLKFSRKEEMKSHQKTHTGEQTFTCSYCDLKFSHKSLLQNHLMIHTKEKPYTCNQCNYKFRTNYHLKRHEMLHTGDKLYSCSYCDRKFIRKDHLGRHLKKHTAEAESMYSRLE